MKLNKSFHIYARFQTVIPLKGIFLFIILLLSHAVKAQADADPDFMRSTGKIYVVAAVTLVILCVLLIYMISIDRKISRLEKRHKNE
jgi:hypothetical protein